jgi:RNA polymerase sigma-70 factor, ECF subfamily
VSYALAIDTRSDPGPGLGASAHEGPATSRRGLDRAANLHAVSAEDDLVARCRRGDKRAFREIWELYRVDVTRLLYRMVGRRSELDDLLQEVFVQVHRSIGSFRAESRLSTWIYRVAVNVALMYRRAAKSRPVLVAVPQEPLLLDETSPPDEQLLRRRRIEALYRLLDRVSDKKRAVYVLHELEGMTPNEISKVVGAPVLTVRTRLFYARREVLAMLRDEPALAAIADELAAPESPRKTSVGEPHKEPA